MAQAYDYQVQFLGPGNIYAGQNLYLNTTISFTGTSAVVSLDTAQLSGQPIPFEVFCGPADCNPGPSGAGFLIFSAGTAVFRIAIPANTTPGPYTVSLATSSQGIKKTITASFKVQVPPAALPAPPALPSIPIPGMSLWGTTLSQVAPLWCPTGPLDFSNEQLVWYYDGARTYFEMADYTSNKSWESCAFDIARQYRDLINTANGGIPGWRIFSRGLRLAYERSGDTSFQQALILMSRNAAFADRAGDVSDVYIRETSYVLNAYVEAERVGAPRHPMLPRAVDYLLGHFDRIFVSHNYIINQTFYDGLAAEALINYYELTKDPRVPPAIKTMLDWTWTYGYNHSTHQMVYNPDPVGPTCSTGCQYYATDYINMIVPAFGWYWSVTGNPTYQQEGDEIFSHALDTPVDYSAKVFNQNFRWSYITYRTVSSTPPPPSTFTPIRVHAGGIAVTDPSGNVWSADTGFTGGTPYGSNSPIAGTPVPGLYQTERYSTSILEYDFAVPNGSYAVNLKFAEIFYTSPGQRVFNIVINGQPVQPNFDIIPAAGGPLKAIDKGYTVVVTNGRIMIQLTPVVSYPKISAIEIVSGVSTPPAPVPPPNPSFSTIRVNAGGAGFTDASGYAWASDTGYANGSIYAINGAIAGTTSQSLYQTERFSASTLQYDFPVPNGSYVVNLKFAEIWFQSAGQRVFNITINGQPVETNFDALAQAGGPLKPVDKSYPVNVTTGHVVIQLIPVISNPKVSGIEILAGTSPLPPTGLTSPLRINAGGATFTDSSGVVWAPDTDYANGSIYAVNGNTAIAGTTTQSLYQTERFSASTLQYDIPVPNGTYTVNLKFAEIWFPSAGQRVFDIMINGQTVQPKFDIVAAAGGPLKAIDKSYSVSVTTGKITIQLAPIVSNPKISAIEIM